jgi:hypothetical protein
VEADEQAAGGQDRHPGRGRAPQREVAAVPLPGTLPDGR